MSKSNIGRVLEKISHEGPGGRSAVREGTDGGAVRQRRFEYEDGVIARSVEAREQIRRMAQPFVFSREEMDARHLLADGDESDEVYSLLNDLRNRITMSRPGMGVTVLVTSIDDSRQSSILARNLASVIAADESRTSLLVELWNTGSKLTGDDHDGKGVLEFIDDDELAVEDILAPTGVRRMRNIPFGSQGVVNYEYLRSTQLRILIKDVTRRYPRDRFTILDAPPVNRASDVELLNEYVDQIIVCLPYGKTTLGEARKGLAKLDKNKLLGVVLCGAPELKGLKAKLAR